MIVKVNHNSPVPVCEQIRSQIGRLITSEELVQDTQLPPIRQLASDLGLAKDTVARAYELLERDHLVVRAGRRGTTVSRGQTSATETNKRIKQAAADFALAAAQLGISPEDACVAVRKAMLSFR